MSYPGWGLIFPEEITTGLILENENISLISPWGSCSFSDHRALKRITKSSFWLTHWSPRVSPTAHPHHLPLELWHVPWRPGDMLFWPPFKDSPLSCWKCCQWAIFSLQSFWRGSLYVMTHPNGGIKAWPVDMSEQPWRAIFTPEPS